MIISSRFVAGCRDAFIASPSANACDRIPVVPSLITLIDAAFLRVVVSFLPSSLRYNIGGAIKINCWQSSGSSFGKIYNYK